jgi:NAD(P)-dependent dehydrogenase (short-subunit alcohol dehydrogenase family)
MPRLDGRVAVVTGVSPNVMGGIAEALAGEGAAVVAVDRNEEYARGCAEYIKSQGGKALAVACDVADEASVKDMVDAVVAAFGRIDILVNGAAVQTRKSILDTEAGEWRRQVDIILTGAFLCTKWVAKSMIDAGVRGSIVNIVSAEGHQGLGGNIAYSSAKGGLLHFTRSAAMDLAPYGIRVNSVTPTATDPRESFDRAARWGVRWTGPMGAELDREELLRQFLARFEPYVPLGRLPRPSDYGPAVVYLASDEASMVTGVDIRVDGGAVAKHWAWMPKLSS